jgi:hypothetical protein
MCDICGSEIARQPCEAAMAISQLVVLTDLDRGLQLLYQIDCEKAFISIDKIRISRACEECMTLKSLLGEHQSGLHCIEMEGESKEKVEQGIAERR